MDLAFNNLQLLICHKTKPNQTHSLVSQWKFTNLIAYHLCTGNKFYFDDSAQSAGVVKYTDCTSTVR